MGFPLRRETAAPDTRVYRASPASSLRHELSATVRRTAGESSTCTAFPLRRTVRRIRYAPPTSPYSYDPAGQGQMCEEFKVSRKTAREAVRALRETRLVRTVRGKGTYVLGD